VSRSAEERKEQAVKEFISTRWSTLIIGAVLAVAFFLAGLFVHDLIFPQREIGELKTQLEDLQDQVKALSEQVAKLSQGQGGGETKPQEPERVEVSIDDDPVLGQADAPVVIVEFSDFQCPYCKRFIEQTMPQLKREYIDTGKVKLVFRDFPLSFHQNAALAAEAAQCAYEQDSYWEMHDRIFAGQGEWSGSSEAKEIFIGYAEELGLDRARFRECLDSGRYKEEVQQDFKDGASYGVGGTPTFFINGRKLVGAQPFSAFQQVIEDELK
jgi:protein-disulfide isomerase